MVHHMLHWKSNNLVRKLALHQMPDSNACCGALLAAGCKHALWRSCCEQMCLSLSAGGAGL